MKKHKNIPVFIPHLGCPNNCVFCNQRTISGTRDFDIGKVPGIIDEALSTIDTSACDVQLAFFGGSFTGIDRGDMLYLLGLGKKYIDRGLVGSIRLSTRPDYIDREILDILAAHGVAAIELGIQSLSPEVLRAAGRGHTVDDSARACALIKEYGCFELVGQMMTALPRSSAEDDRATARGICAFGCDGARIYPTMVFRGTELENMLLRGEYTPPELDELISVAADVFGIFTDNGVEVIRIGLAESDGLHTAEGISAGAYHCAMGELVTGEYYRRLICAELDTHPREALSGADITIKCARGETSKICGHKSRNKTFIYNEYNVKNIKVIENDGVLLYNCSIMF